MEGRPVAARSVRGLQSAEWLYVPLGGTQVSHKPIVAPREVPVHREEVAERIRAEAAN